MTSHADFLREQLAFSQESFYFLQVIRRKKDNPDQQHHAKVLRSYYINSREQWDRKMPEIEKLVKDNNARAYLCLNPKVKEWVASRLLQILAERFMGSGFDGMEGDFNSACGSVRTQKVGRLWVLDIDKPYAPEDLRQLKHLLGVNFRYQLLTKNGVHFVVYTHNAEQYLQMSPVKYEVKKDANTLLMYC